MDKLGLTGVFAMILGVGGGAAGKIFPAEREKITHA